MSDICEMRRDAGRIASSLFCGSDPAVVTFAKARTAQFWGLPEDTVDVLVAVELLAGTTRLADDLRTPGRPERGVYLPETTAPRARAER